MKIMMHRLDLIFDQFIFDEILLMYPVPWKFLHDEKIKIRRIEIIKIVENNFLKYVSKIRIRKMSF